MAAAAPAPRYKRHRFPAEIISHCVWLYFCLPLSYRQVELVMAQRGIDVTYEAIRLPGHPGADRRPPVGRGVGTFPPASSAPLTRRGACPMTRGTIKHLHAERGFGVITPDAGGPDLFLHQTAVLGLGVAPLGDGQRVEDDRRVDPGDRHRVRAFQVRPIEDGGRRRHR